MSQKQLAALLTAIGLVLGGGYVVREKIAHPEGPREVSVVDSAYAPELIRHHQEQTLLLREIARDLAVIRSLTERDR